jgi:acetyl esterase/lipase
MSLKRIVLRSGVACVLAVGLGVSARAQALAPREVPAKSIPVPTTVSPELQQVIAGPLRKAWDQPGTNAEEWKQLAETSRVNAVVGVTAQAARLHVTFERATMAGVRVFKVTPEKIAPGNENRLLIQIHGGCYVLLPGEGALGEAILAAGLGGFQVIAVDYRMPPEAYFPAALDDVMTVYREVLKTHDARRVGLIGSSAGGALVLEATLRAKQEGLAFPGAIAPGTPMSDATGAGDSFQVNEFVDSVLVSPHGFCDAATKFYAQGHDLRDPMLSPVYGDMSGFPPTILTTGTRDLLLSNTVRVHRKLRNAGVEAFLQVYEGQSHSNFGRDDRMPETREAFGEITQFLASHLAK